MAKKIEKRFHARITKNTAQGGSWLTLTRIDEPNLGNGVQDYTAWSNPSAAKRHVKKILLEITGRKSIKMVATKLGENDKPVEFMGDVMYKVAE